MLNIDCNAPVVHSQNDREEDGIVNTGEKIPIGGMMTMSDQLIAGLEQCTFIRQQVVTAAFSI
jgi:hypothetical protein